jgi:membrane fusion protein, heavy metal efflux system
VRIEGGEDLREATATIEYLSPVGAAATQTLLARAILPNSDGRWWPGLFVSAEVVVEAAEVPVAVRAPALQRWRDGEVVFVREGEVFEAQPVRTGRRDRERVEVLEGLAPGREYVAEGSFVLKAEIGKSAASHDH